jgi:hypothetical protein
MGYDVDRYRKLLADAVDDEKRLALIDLLIKERAKERLEAHRASDRVAIMAVTIAEVLRAGDRSSQELAHEGRRLEALSALIPAAPEATRRPVELGLKARK